MITMTEHELANHVDAECIKAARLADRAARKDCARICRELAANNVELYDACDCAYAIQKSIK